MRHDPPAIAIPWDCLSINVRTFKTPVANLQCGVRGEVVRHMLHCVFASGDGKWA